MRTVVPGANSSASPRLGYDPSIHCMLLVNHLHCIPLAEVLELPSANQLVHERCYRYHGKHHDADKHLDPQRPK